MSNTQQNGSQNQFTVQLGGLNVPVDHRNLHLSNMARGLLPSIPGQLMRSVRPGFHVPNQITRRENPVLVNMDQQLSYPDTYSNNNSSHSIDLSQELENIQQIHYQDTDRPPGGSEEATPNGSEGPVDWRLFISWLQNSGIFIILLFLRLLYDHRLGLLIFIALGGTFYYVNQKLVLSIHQFSVRETDNYKNRLKLLGLVMYLSVNVAFVYYMFFGEGLWKGLIFQTPNLSYFDIWTLLWVVLINDFMVKFCTVIMKACITMLPANVLKHRRRGKYYMLLEHTSLCYRQLLPIIPWFHFLSNSLHGKWFTSFEVIIYSLFKANIVWMSLKDLHKAFQRFRVHTVFGVKPSLEDLKQRGESCPICQDDLKDPVMLSCKHIFCEDCVCVWFDRERTCPMCRANITDNPRHQDGSTSMHLQWY